MRFYMLLILSKIKYYICNVYLKIPIDVLLTFICCMGSIADLVYK